MSPTALPTDALPHEDEPELPIVPTEERWRAMSPGERSAFMDLAMTAVQRQAELMGEGSRHSRPKMRMYRGLSDHFQRAGRDVYVNVEMPIYYPGERVFCPDLFAVDGVPDPGDADQRRAWALVDEGRGIDLALEVLDVGDANKDPISNVAFFARLGIQEYFVYDRRKERIYGWRLGLGTPRRYQSIVSRGALYPSRVLGLELGFHEGRIRFFHSGSLVAETEELLHRANSLLDEVEQRLEVETARAAAEAARAAAETERAAMEAARAELANRRAEDEAARTAAEATRAELATRRAEDEAARADAEGSARAELERIVAELRARLSEP